MPSPIIRFHQILCAIGAILIFSGPIQLFAREFTPGVFREYVVNADIANRWRVTDPGATNSGALEFLPNFIFTIPGVDLTNATRAELTMHHWAGHSDTVGQQVIINDDHFLDVPVNEGLDVFFAVSRYLNCDNPVMEVPLEWLESGDNTIQGTIAEEHQGTHWWGQWGWYWIKLRIWVDESNLDVPDGTIVVNAPDKVITGKTVSLTFEPDEPGVTEVKYFARYFGFDEDGDGSVLDWHGFDDSYSSSTGNVTSTRHVGTSNSSSLSFQVNWDVEWLPDQQPGAISFIALVRKGTNEFRVTEPIHGYTIDRNYSVKLIRPKNWAYALIRAGISAGATVYIPNELPLETMDSARIMMRSWNGQANEHGSTPLSINYAEYQSGIITGANHNYALADNPLPLDKFTLRNGNNTITMRATTEHHGCEILAPGPCLVLRWNERIPDYLSAGAPIVNGWYMGNAEWIYYIMEHAPWMWSANYEWIYAYSPYSVYGWNYSPTLGFIWTHRDYNSWVYLASQSKWGKFQSRNETGFTFLDPDTQQTFVISK